VIWAWFVGGVIIIIFSWYRARSRSVGKERTLDQLTWQGALAIGLMQCLAMLPGTSRSLATILGGVLVGLGISAAVEFSFLLGVLTLLAATAYKTKDAGPVMFAQYSWPILALSTLSAWLSAVLAVKWMVGYLRKHDIRVFGYYRIGLAVIVGGLVYWGVVRE
jgi:undecaprenyl-diphosphatase